MDEWALAKEHEEVDQFHGRVCEGSTRGRV